MSVTYWTQERIVAAIQGYAERHGRPPVAQEWEDATPVSPNQTVVKRRFGDWASAIEAAGFPRPRAQRLGERKQAA